MRLVKLLRHALTFVALASCGTASRRPTAVLAASTAPGSCRTAGRVAALHRRAAAAPQYLASREHSCFLHLVSDECWISVVSSVTSFNGSTNELTVNRLININTLNVFQVLPLLLQISVIFTVL